MSDGVQPFSPASNEGSCAVPSTRRSQSSRTLLGSLKDDIPASPDKRNITLGGLTNLKRSCPSFLGSSDFQKSLDGLAAEKIPGIASSTSQPSLATQVTKKLDRSPSLAKKVTMTLEGLGKRSKTSKVHVAETSETRASTDPFDTAADEENAPRVEREDESFANNVVAKFLLSVQGEGDQKAKSRLQKFVESGRFQLSIMLLISINTIYIGVETDWNTAKKEDFLPWLIAECIFTVLFVVEITFRISADGRQFCMSWWNLFDLFIVIISVVDVISEISVHLRESEGDLPQWMSSLSILKMMRYARILRVVRLLKMFKELWLLVSGVISSMATLFWTWCLMVTIIYIFAIFATRSLGQPWSECGQGQGTGRCNEDMKDWFGTVPRSMFTFFQLVTFEEWNTVWRESMKVMPLARWVFVLFLLLTSFGLWNVVIAVIVQVTLDQAAVTQDDLVKQGAKDRESAIKRIVEIFMISDEDGNGTLTREEFVKALSNDEVKRNLSQVKIDLRGAEGLFDTLDYDDSGSLDVDEFVEGCLRARGPANSKDVLALQCDVWRTQRGVLEAMEDFMQMADDNFEYLSEAMTPLVANLRQGNFLRPGTAPHFSHLEKVHELPNSAAEPLDHASRRSVSRKTLPTFQEGQDTHSTPPRPSTTQDALRAARGEKKPAEGSGPRRTRDDPEEFPTGGTTTMGYPDKFERGVSWTPPSSAEGGNRTSDHP